MNHLVLHIKKCNEKSITSLHHGKHANQIPRGTSTGIPEKTLIQLFHRKKMECNSDCHETLWVCSSSIIMGPVFI